MVSSLRRNSTLVLLCWFLALPAQAAVDWPHTRGPAFDGQVAAPGTFESGHIGLDLAWRIPLGSGYSGIAVADGRAVTMFAEGEGDWVGAFDVAGGKELWRYKIDAINKGYDGADDGPLSSPIIANGSVFALSSRGHLTSLALKDGSHNWTRRLDEDFGGHRPEYGFTTSPLVAGKVVIVQAGGNKGRALVGLNARNGKKLWTHGDGSVDYQSPALMTLAGKTQVVAIDGAGISGIDAGDGKPLWRHPFAEGDRSRSSTPTFVGEDRFLVGVSGEAVVYRVASGDDGMTVEELYRSNALGNTYALPVYHDGHIYGYRGQILACIDAASGERKWRSREPGGDGLILVDRHLVLFGGLGNVVVAAASPEGYEEFARVQALEGSSLSWPSFADGKIFVRNLSELSAVDVTRQAARMGQADVPGDLAFSRWLKQAEASDNPSAMVNELLNRQGPPPIVDGEYVTFVYRGKGKDVAIAGTMIPNESTQPMHHLAGTDLFHRTYRLEPGVRWEYRYQIDFDDWVTDPFNERSAPALDGEGQVSELLTEGYVESAVIEDPADLEGPRGSVETFVLTSEILGNEREIKVWLPPGYATSSRDYPILLINDGPAWFDKALLANTLENVVGSRVDPVIAVFVSPARRWWHDSGDSTIDAYLKMQFEELLPALQEKYRLSGAPGAHGVMGNRFYAMAAVLAAFRQPEVFGRVGIQSAYTSGPQLAEMHELMAARPSVRFYVDWNRYDERNVDREWDMGELTAALAQTLEQQGFSVTGGEAADSVGWGGWRNRTDDLLVALFPAD